MAVVVAVVSESLENARWLVPRVKAHDLAHRLDRHVADIGRDLGWILADTVEQQIVGGSHRMALNLIGTLKRWRRCLALRPGLPLRLVPYDNRVDNRRLPRLGVHRTLGRSDAEIAHAQVCAILFYEERCNRRLQQERNVDQVFLDQDIGHGESQHGIGAGTDRHEQVGLGRERCERRVDDDDLAPRLDGIGQEVPGLHLRFREVRAPRDDRPRVAQVGYLVIGSRQATTVHRRGGSVIVHVDSA